MWRYKRKYDKAMENNLHGTLNTTQFDVREMIFTRILDVMFIQ